MFLLKEQGEDKAFESFLELAGDQGSSKFITACFLLLCYVTVGLPLCVHTDDARSARDLLLTKSLFRSEAGATASRDLTYVHAASHPSSSTSKHLEYHVKISR